MDGNELYSIYNIASSATAFAPYFTYNLTGSMTSAYDSNFINNKYDDFAIKYEYDTSATGIDMLRYPSQGYASAYTGGGTWIAPVVAPGDRMRQMIQARIAPAFHRGRARVSLSIAMDVREERARQTLRRIIGEQAYRKFFRDGFITVVPKSGLTYRIFPGHDITEVYDRGIMVERLCVVLQGNFPPTDSLIMRYLLVLNDEGEFSKYAVKHRIWKTAKNKTIYDLEDQAESKTEAGLTKEWAKLKVA